MQEDNTRNNYKEIATLGYSVENVQLIVDDSAIDEVEHLQKYKNIEVICIMHGPVIVVVILETVFGSPCYYSRTRLPTLLPLCHYVK